MTYLLAPHTSHTQYNADWHVYMWPKELRAEGQTFNLRYCGGENGRNFFAKDLGNIIRRDEARV